METTIRLQTTPAAPPRSPAVGLPGIPWYVYATVFSSLCIIVGLIWDISWHTSIGRDGLLSPPHLVIYLGAVVSGVFSGYQVLKTTFAGTPAEKGRSVRFWGVFHGSTGAMFCIWGAFAMLTSAPFDDWWHNTYGLDVVILSPPHVVLITGMMMVQFGAIIGVLALQNRNENASGWSIERIERRNYRLRVLFVVAAGLLLVALFTLASDSLDRFSMHHSSFYQIASLLFPLLLVATARASKLRWAATATVGVYSVILALLVWILPLFPAEPKLGPVLNHITHYQAFQFPLLLVFPALAIDWLLNRFAGKNDWLLSVIIAFFFLVVLLAVQWPMGNLLMSPVGRSWVFGQESWYFGIDPTWEYRFKYAPWNQEGGPVLLKGLGIAFGIGVVSTRIGLVWGKWMQKIQR